MAGGSEIITVLFSDTAPPALLRSRTTEVEERDDGVVLLFKSAVDALDCAVELADAGVPRIGVSAGEAPRERDGWSGPAVVEAQRLRDAARPGTVLVADLVRDLLGGRRALVLRAAALENAWEWSPDDGRAAVPLPPALASATHRSPFVGRVAELGRLRAAWRQAEAGMQHVVAIGGEPGIGKTRLAAELAREAHASGAVVFHGRTDEDLGAPYKPFIEGLTHYVRHADSESLRRQLGSEGRELFRLLPGLAERLPDLGAPTRSDPEAERFLLFEAMTAFLARVATETPIVLVLDDLHWADKPSLLLLQRVARQPARLLIVCTFRDTEVGPRHPFTDVLTALRRDNVLDRVALRAIGARELPGFAASFPGLDADAGFWARVHDQTGGNPFFIEEVLRHAAEVGTSDAGVPEGVSEIVERRVNRLSDPAQRVLAVASVCGHEFDTAAVESAVELDEDAVLDALDEAGAAGVIVEVGSTGRWAFSHALVRQSMYEGLSAGRRTRLHWRLGDVLSGQQRASAAEVANHLVAGVAAGDPRRTVAACLEAADEARQLGGFETIIVHADRALAVLRDTGTTDTELEYQATMARADAAYGLADIVASVAAYRCAAELARDLNDPVRFAEAVIGYAGPIRIEPDDDVVAFLNEALTAVGPAPSPQRVLLLAEQIDITVTWLGRGPLKAALEEMVAAAAQLDDIPAKAAASRAEGRYWEGSPNIDALARAAQPGVELSSLIDDGRYISARGFISSRIDMAYVAISRGDRSGFDAALADVTETLKGLFFARWNAAVFRAAATIAEGRLDEARQQVAAARDIPPVATGGFLATYRAQMTAIRIAEGAIDGLIPRLTEFVARSHPGLAVPHRAMLAGVLARSGDVDRAQAELDVLAAAEFTDLPDDWLRPLTLRWAAEACAALADRGRAALLEPYVRPYLGLLWIQAYAMTIEGAAARSLAQLVAVQGRLDEATTLYRQAIDLEEGAGFHGLATESRDWSHKHTG